MKIAFLTPAGKFPTLMHDPGVLWSTASRHEGSAVRRVSVNFEWWRVLCGPALAGLSPSGKLTGLGGLAGAAGLALEDFRKPDVYAASERYLKTSGAFSDFLDAFNCGQDELEIGIFSGPSARGLEYADSGALAAYADRDTLLSRSIAAAMGRLNLEADVFIFTVTFPQDLLTAMITARLLRERLGPDPYICLADHGYENFSLHSHAPALEESGHLLRFFDGIIVSKQERRPVLAHLLEKLEAGVRLEGFLACANLGLPKDPPFSAYAYVPSPPLPTFAPGPVLWTRFSERRCYWSRCTFCVQNAKYDNPTPPSLKELEPSLDKLEVLIAAGYRHLIFSDEALSPAVLSALADGILRRGLKLRWSVRCRIETTFTPEIFARMRESGCYEILFGLESASDRMLKLMEKHDKGLDLEFVSALFRSCDAAGIGLHITMISGFPGDTPAESAHTVEFVSKALRGLRNATFKLNFFNLFPDTPVFQRPERFGVVVGDGGGDMPMSYPYELIPTLSADGEKVAAAYDESVTRLYDALGWTDFTRRRGGGADADMALDLYFHTGQGTFLKTDAASPFADPISN